MVQFMPTFLADVILRWSFLSGVFHHMHHFGFFCWIDTEFRLDCYCLWSVVTAAIVCSWNHSTLLQCMTSYNLCTVCKWVFFTAGICIPVCCKVWTNWLEGISYCWIVGILTPLRPVYIFIYCNMPYFLSMCQYYFIHVYMYMQILKFVI